MINAATLHHILRGPFNFLRPDVEEVREILGDARELLPEPHRIYLEDDTAAPFFGFPLLVSPDLRALGNALAEYLQAEEVAQVAMVRRHGFDRRTYEVALDRFTSLLARAVENVTASAYGPQHAAVFWLFQSLDVSRLLRETPKRLMRLDSSAGRQYGDTIKYLVLEKYLDLAFAETYEQAQELARQQQDSEDVLFPSILQRMRDNVLVFTETYVSRDLSELATYFAGHLRLDNKEFRQRLDNLEEWHRGLFDRDPDLRAAATHLMGEKSLSDPRELILRPGYAAYLAARRDYDPQRLLSPAGIQIWESLLAKLKEFELFHAWRRLILPLERRDGKLVQLGRGPGDARQHALPLSPATRPLDFMTPWVVDPIVDRCGLVYDISNFSEIVSVLGWSGAQAQDTSFRMIFRFQRHANRLASAQRLTLEKYLGDGAFYSGREARRMVIAAIRIQRHYAQVVAEGFPFNRGMRIALAWSQYRMLPLQGGPGGPPERYEFFGQGLVELSRMVTGKSAREVDEIKTLLLGLGYPEGAVNRFFAPLTERNVDVIDKDEESRQFYAYLNANGTLINEGIVATGGFVARFCGEGGFQRLLRTEEGSRSYIVVPLEAGGDSLHVGLRKLGTAQFKGLERQPIFEIIDADQPVHEPLAADPTQLLTELESDFAATMRRRRATAAS